MNYPDDFLDQIIQGDSLEVMKEIPDNSIDAVITDPPYGLGFMGKEWDTFEHLKELQYFSFRWASECLRVLKPGGYLLSFGGTRTYHRIASGIEDAGFEIRDMIAWVYGSGFPKSLNIGKAVDKLRGNDRKVIGEINTHDIRSGSLMEATIPELKKEISTIRINITKGNSEWEGWGTALKPALEPITVARKPISEKNIAENVLKWGTGGINIDECRVGSRREKGQYQGQYQGQSQVPNRTDKLNYYPESLGRFPSNFIHDGSEEVLELFPKDNDKSPARFFYCAKASKSERNAGLERFDTYNKNFHPTVKPIKLMEYLITLVTPKDGIVLDPFMGSGTTGVACKNLNRNFIGIEIDPEYFSIAKKRIEEVKNESEQR